MKHAVKTVMLQVRAESDLLDQLDQLAQEVERSRSDTARRLIRWAISQEAALSSLSPGARAKVARLARKDDPHEVRN